MGIQFDWQAGDDSGQWEKIAETKRRRWLRNVPRWIWYALTAVLVIGLAGGYFVVRRRYDQAQGQILFQVQSVIDLEARSFAQGDRDLFLAQQDHESPDWYDLQKSRASAACASEHPTSAYCSPVLPAQIENFDLRGNVAWVEVLESDPPVRRARFYRQTDLGWKHTAPRASFWGPSIELHYGDVLLRYHRKDQPHIDPLLDRIVEAFYETCRDVGCPDDKSIEIDFAVDEFLPVDRVPPMEGDQWLLPSPWLSGVPVDGTIDTSYVQSLTDQLARGLAAQAMGIDGDSRISTLKEVLLDEYVAWRNEGSTSAAPILGHIVSLRGPGIIPGVFQWLAGQENPNLDDLLGRWLSLSPTGRGPVHFAALLNIEREALLTGSKETFLFLQDSRDENWAAQRATFFDRVQTYEDMPTGLRIGVEVEQVRIDGDRALVTLAKPLPRLQGSVVQSMGNHVFFSLDGGEWKHNSVAHAVYWQIPIEQVRLAPSMDLPRQEGVRISFLSNESDSVLQSAVASFHDRYPWVRVETPRIDDVISMPEGGIDSTHAWIELFQVLFYQMAAIGDVLQWPFFSDLSAPYLLYDLAPLVDSDPTFAQENFYPGMLEASRWGEQIWVLPVYGIPYVIYYDRSAFDSAGLEYPQPGWSMEEFAETARALTVREGGQTVRYGFGESFVPSLMRAFVESRAGPLVDPTTSPVTIRLNDPRTVEAVQWYLDLAQEGTVPHPRDSSGEDPEPTPKAMWIEPFQVSLDTLGGAELGMAPFPAGPHAYHPWTMVGLAIAEGTLYPEESWLWMQFALSLPDMHGLFVDSSSSVPARSNTAETTDFWERLEPALEPTVREAMIRPSYLLFDTCTAALQEALESIWRGTPVQEALDEAQASMEQELIE